MPPVNPTNHVTEIRGYYAYHARAPERGMYPGPAPGVPVPGEPGFVPLEGYPRPPVPHGMHHGHPYRPHSRPHYSNPSESPSILPPGEEEYPVSSSRRRVPPPPPNPFDYPRRGRTRSPRRRRTRSKTGSPSRSQSRDHGKKKKKLKKSKGKRSRSSSSSSNSSSRSRSGSPKLMHTNWLEVIKKMDTKDSGATTVLPPDVVAKLAAAGLWPPPGQVASSIPSGHFPSQGYPQPAAATPVLSQVDSSSNLTPPPPLGFVETKKEEKRKEENQKAEKGSQMSSETRKKFTDQREKLCSTQDMIIGEIFHLQFSHAELLAKMFKATKPEEVSEHNKLITENVKLQNELVAKLQGFTKSIGKLNEFLQDGSTVGDLNFDVEYYDGKNHFCVDCKIFCESAQDYLQHCTTLLHKKFAKTSEDTPWRKSTDVKTEVKPEKVSDKRAPLKGLPFILPVEAYYCKVCSTWVGDNDDVMKHVVSPEHNAKFFKFSMDVPEWESNYVAKRQKAAKNMIRQNIEKLFKPKDESKLGRQRSPGSSPEPVKHRSGTRERTRRRSESSGRSERSETPERERRHKRSESRDRRRRSGTPERTKRRSETPEQKSRSKRSETPEQPARSIVSEVPERDQCRTRTPERDAALTGGGRSIRVNMRDSVVPTREVRLEQPRDNGRDPLVDAWAPHVQESVAFAALREKLKKAHVIQTETAPSLKAEPAPVIPKTAPAPVPPPKPNSNLKPFFIGKMPVKKLPNLPTAHSPPSSDRHLQSDRKSADHGSRSSDRGAYSERKSDQKPTSDRQYKSKRQNFAVSIPLPVAPLSPKNIFPQFGDADDLHLLGIGRDDIAASGLQR